MGGEIILDEQEVEDYVLDNITVDIEDSTKDIVIKTLELEDDFLIQRGIIVIPDKD